MPWLREQAHPLAHGIGLAAGEVGTAAVQPLVLRQQLGPVAFERREEMLARAGAEVEEIRPDSGRSRGARLAHDLVEQLAPIAEPGRIGAIPTLALTPASTSRERARSRWRGGAVPGSVRRQISSSRVGTENVTETRARHAASARTSTSRTISGPA
jgi:hypothetical protein